MTIQTSYLGRDLIGSAEATALFSLIALIPGYVIAWIFQLFEFRQQSFFKRAAIGIAVSVSACPVLTYLLGTYVSMTAVWCLYFALSAAFVILLWFEWKSENAPVAFPISRYARIGVGVAFGWAVLAIFSLVDLQFGDRLYFPVSAYDYNTRTALVSAMGRNNLPPVNPLFYPGYHVPLRYHYFWCLQTSLVDRIGGSAVRPHDAVLGSTVWAGLALLAIVVLYANRFDVGERTRSGRRTLIAVGLLAVTGLDLIPTLLLRTVGVMYPDMEWWNNPVMAWIHATLWATHHIVGLVSCLTAFLILFEARATFSDTRRIVGPAAIAALGFASAAGMSVYIIFIFAIVVAIWFLFVLWKRWYDRIPALVVCGVMSCVFAAPYLSSVLASRSAADRIIFKVRSLYLADIALQSLGTVDGWRLGLANAALLPLNYAVELGFFLAIGIWKLKLLSRERKMRAEDTALSVMLVTAVVVCSLLATFPSNDLGWRGFLIAQFVLLIWSIDPVDRWLERKAKSDTGLPRWLNAMMLPLLVIGILGSVYAVGVHRLYPVLLDSRNAPLVPWLSTDQNLGSRTYALRAAFQTLDEELPATAIVQTNPNLPWDLFEGLYGNRQTVAFNPACGSTYGGDPRLCTPVRARIDELFAAGNIAPDAVRKTCRDLSIDVLLVKDIDPVWSDRQSWLWQMKPVVENSYSRAIACRQ